MEIKNKINITGREEGNDNKFLFEHRIMLGSVFDKYREMGVNEENSFMVMLECFQVLHYDQVKDIKTPSDMTKLITTDNVRYFHAICDGLKYWLDREKKLLKPSYTADELAAGVTLLSEKFGHFSTIMALAEKFSKTPDEITEWEYTTVLTTLFYHQERNKFEKNLHKIHERKSKRKR